MSEPRFIDVDIEGVQVKYLSEDGKTIPWDIYEKMRSEILETMKRACPLCHSTSINYVSDNILQCNACSYEDLDTFFYE